MGVQVVEQLAPDLIGPAWALYYHAFVELNALAVQRHLMNRAEFDEQMLDRRVQKYLCLDPVGTLSGLATYTNDLMAMSLISSDYFRRAWPEHFEQRRIWYCGFVAVRQRQSSEAFAELIAAMYHQAKDQDALIGMDICRFNDDQRHLSRVITLMLQRLSGNVRAERLDEQSYWLYEFPPVAQESSGP